MDCFLAGDLGGTKTILALYRSSAQGFSLLRGRRFVSAASYPDFIRLLADFLAEGEESPQVAAFGVAGPLSGQGVRLTNLRWDLDSQSIRDRFGFTEVLLLNDLVAVARAVPSLTATEMLLIHSGKPRPRGSKAVLAPGTGLGEAFLCWSESGYQTLPSEGGHCDFAPTSPLEWDLLRFLQAEHHHVSYELVCSGLGIANIFRFLSQRAGMVVPADLAEELVGSDDPTPVLVARALAGDCPIARQAIDLFLAILAAEAGNMALKLLTTGGIYLAGGMLPRLLPIFDQSRFMERFLDKGRMTGILATIPIAIITSENIGLLGAADAGHELLRSAAARQ